jgi:CheY-specific phosphatase CheX
MSVKFFGQFLLERKKITSEQLLQAVRYQDARNLKFGDYARKLGYLTAQDVRRLNNEQKRADMLIGELSVKLGLLSRPQVDEVLTMQKNDHVLLGEAVVAMGFLPEADISRELLAFHEDQKPYAPADIRVPDGVGDAETFRSMADLTRKMLMRIAKLDAKIGTASVVANGPARQYAAVAVHFRADTKFTYVLAVSRAAAVPIATGIIGLDASGEKDAMLVDSVQEFCNIVCGNVIAAMARRGKSVDISPPEALSAEGGEYALFYGDRRAVEFPFASTSGALTLYVMEG